MKDFSNIESATPITVGAEIVDIISEYTEKPWYIFRPEETGVYKIEYTKDTIDTIFVFEKPKHFFQHSRLVDKTSDLSRKRWIELFYLEKGKIYFINVALKPYLRYGSYLLKLDEHEVPASNTRDTAREVDPSKIIEGRLDYVTDVDWYTFTIKDEADYKFIYSREINDAVFLYKEDKNKELVPISDKMFLVNDTVCENYHLEPMTYFMKVEHYKFRKLGKYTVKITKDEQKTSRFARFLG